MLITVVTPTWNAARYLDECIISVSRNRSRDFEIDHVIVDGGSTDDTVQIARRHRVRLIQGKDNGIFDAINIGSFNSKGSLLGFLGADDLMLDGALSEVAHVYRERQSPWVVGGIRFIDRTGRNLGELRPPPSWIKASMHACIGWNPIMHMATYFSRELFQQLGGFNLHYRHSADYEMFVRALLRERFATVPATLACFRLTGENNSAVNRQDGLRENRQIADAFGPKHAVPRAMNRYLWKVWLNARNPGWSARKLLAKPANG